MNYKWSCAAVLFFLIIPIAYAGCADDKTTCYEECNKECDKKKYTYCRTYEYSGCALDVFCDCNKCDLLDNKWCPKKGFNECANPATTKYENCITTCQTDREAGNDISTCWKDCNDQLTAGLLPCKNEQCESSCASEGYAEGSWASYTQSGGYDSCSCTGKKDSLEPIPDEKAPEPDLFSDEVVEIPETVTAPAEDPFEDYDESSNLETVANVLSGKTIKDFFKHWFSSAENKGTKGKVGFVKAVKDKEGVRVFRNGKYQRVGVHTPLMPGDRLRTGPNSKIQLILLNADGTQDVIDVRSNSLYEVEGSKYEDHDDTIRIVKLIGSITATIKRRASGDKPNFYVKTPTVSSGIRGTQFYMSFDKATRETVLIVKEGEVEFAGKTTKIVKAGEQIVAQEDILGDVEDLDTSKWEEVSQQDWDEKGREGFFSIPAVKTILFVVILILGWLGYKKYIKK